MRKALNSIWWILLAPFRLIRWAFRGIGRGIGDVYAEFHEFFFVEVDDSPMADALNKVIDQPQDLFFHLNILRKHLFRSVLALIAMALIAATFFDEIMVWVTRPLPASVGALTQIEPTEGLSVFMRVSLFGGFALAFPYIALELWLFIGPGLSRRTRIFGLFSIPVATLFFLGGVTFAYFAMLPTALPFLFNIGNFQAEPRASAYVRFVTSILFWIGVSFEFPLVIFILAKLGLVSSTLLRRQWRLAVVIIAVIAALVTPTVDPMSMGIVMAPLIVLYILSIGLAALAQPNAANAAG